MIPLRREGRFGLVLTGHMVSTSPTLIKRPGQKEDEMLCWTRIINGTPCRLPVWPGETLKGAMRATAFTILTDAAVRSGHDLTNLSLEDLYTQTKGGVEFTADRGDLGSDDALRAVEPILSLFGAASPRLEGKLSISAAEAGTVTGGSFPALGLPGGARRDPVLTTPGLTNLLSDQTIDDWNDRMAAVAAVSRRKAEAQSAYNDALRALVRARNTDGANVDMHQKAFDAAKKLLDKIKDDPDKLNSLQRPLNQIPAVPAGTVYTHTIRVVDMTLEEVGFLFSILCAMPTLEMGARIGGGRTAGYGYYTGDYTIFAYEDPAARLFRRRMQAIGSVSLPNDGSSGLLTIQEGHPLENALSAWEALEDAAGERLAMFSNKTAKKS